MLTVEPLEARENPAPVSHLTAYVDLPTETLVWHAIVRVPQQSPNVHVIEPPGSQPFDRLTVRV